MCRRPPGRQGQQVDDLDATHALGGRQDDVDTWVVVEEHLAVTPARPGRATAMVADCDDMSDPGWLRLRVLRRVRRAQHTGPPVK